MHLRERPTKKSAFLRGVENIEGTQSRSHGQRVRTNNLIGARQQQYHGLPCTRTSDGMAIYPKDLPQKKVLSMPGAAGPETSTSIAHSGPPTTIAVCN